MATKTKSAKPGIKAVVATAKERSMAVYAKGARICGDGKAMAKANGAAAMESGKVLASGVKDLGKDGIESSRKMVATLADDIAALSAVKSPAELIRLQAKLANRNMNAALAHASKSGSALKTLAAGILAPLHAQAKSNAAAVKSFSFK